MSKCRVCGEFKKEQNELLNTKFGSKSKNFINLKDKKMSKFQIVVIIQVNV